jgi:hypothetical protein
MHVGRTLFSQLLDFLPKQTFDQCVRRYRGNHRIRTFSCFDHYLCMVFAQISGCRSLRDIETSLRTMRSKLYHCGIRGTVSRNTLAKANEQRDWRIYSDFAQVLIARARTLYANDTFGVQLDREVYALDSTTIDLCLTLFPWAAFRRHKAAVKVHTQMDLRGSIPSFIRISDGKLHDVHFLDDVILEPGALYVMDRGYLDFARLFQFQLQSCSFITRAKSNFRYSRIRSFPIDKGTGLRSDQMIRLYGHYARQDYPAALRRIGYVDPETGKRMVFLTNNFVLPALTIAGVFKCRWQIELFFKWIKQYLRIKSFLGTSPNAVKTQIWIAISVYVLVAIVKKELDLQQSLGEILQILDIALFEQVPMGQVLTNMPKQDQNIDDCNRLPLFNL